MQRKARFGVLAVLPVAAAVTLVVLVSGGPAASDGTKQQASFGPGAVVSSAPLAVTKAAQGRILAYWTEERMRNAKPVPAPRVMGKPKSGLTALGPSGPPRTIPGSAPVSSEPPLLDASGGSQTLGYTYPFPYTRHGVDGSVKRPVYRAIGKMFFTQGTTDFVCSGASVVSSPNNAVYTAGHCVSNGASAFSTNVMFAPARNPDAPKNPYGKFPGTQLWTTSAWHFSHDFTGDFAAFAVGTNSSGQTLQSQVGTLGFAYDQSRVQHWDVFGYPGAPFSGNRMITCKASHATDDTAIPGSRPDPIGIGCDMTAGADGGPWIMMLNRGSLINSVSAYRYPSTEPAAMYGPYFDILANQVRCAAATGGSTTC